MIKLFLVGIWVCAVTLGAGYAAVWWQTPHTAAHGAGHEKAFAAVEAIKARMISVPMIADGVIHGYVMAQFTFMADVKASKALSVKPEPVFIDEAFKTIYTTDSIDFRNMRKQDLPGLAKRIIENSNRRLGVPILEDVLIVELNYVPKDRTRTGGKS